ncbi:hypothetical protein [Pareuzebyella sediminis]|uniref:hypothetical protein n=1 Tax=Pareuzebyella sediminis TaxID=2607998 RepID=UPI0011EBC68D|nr:hypothetical protein [Pareuzebyella sediminis]
MDKFEKYILENRKQFDVHKADKEKLWANIEERLGPDSKVIPFWKFPLFKIAATVAVILSVAGLIGVATFAHSGSLESPVVSQELQDIDMYYANLVSYQVRLVEKSSKLSDADKEEFLSFMDELDNEHEELRLELQNNIDNEAVLEAIVANYKKRIELIENLLKQLNEPKVIQEDYGYTL